MKKSLNGKTAIVTGASSGIGREVSLALGKLGVNVICSARNHESIKDVAGLIRIAGGKAVHKTTDVRSHQQVEELIETAIREFGKIDFLYNCAGILRGIGASWEIEPEAWWEDVKTNLYGSFLCCHAVLPLMIKRDFGVIINFDGGGGTGHANTGASGYGCSKAALVRLTESIAGELKQINSNVVVLCYHPGLVKTNMTSRASSSQQGKMWLGRIREGFGTKKELPIEFSVDRAIQLTKIACPELSGRAIRPEIGLDKLEQELMKINQEDLLVLRYKQLNNG